MTKHLGLIVLVSLIGVGCDRPPMPQPKYHRGQSVTVVGHQTHIVSSVCSRFYGRCQYYVRMLGHFGGEILVQEWEI